MTFVAPLARAQVIDLSPLLQDEKRIAGALAPSIKNLQPGEALPEFEAARVYTTSGNGVRLKTLRMKYPTVPTSYLKPLPLKEGAAVGVEPVKVSLRSYFAEPAQPAYKDDHRLSVGPTIVAHPGDTLTFDLSNEMPVEAHSEKEENVPHEFNRTNYHSHGIMTSPVGNSDNVLLEIFPGAAPHLVEIHIPEDHLTGTFWYHPHVHGSTAIQVGSGLAGALLVTPRDLNAKSAAGSHEHLDSLLAEKGLLAENDHTLLFQQIPLLKTSQDGEPAVYGVEDFTAFFDPIRRVGWEQGKDPNGWRTTINGQYMPVLKVKGNTLSRLRLIHGGVREVINFNIRKYNPDETQRKLAALTAEKGGQNERANALSLQDLKKPSIRKLLRQNAPLPSDCHLEVAVDGIPVRDPFDRSPRVRGKSPVVVQLQPGYRSDVLLQLPYEEGGDNVWVIEDGAGANRAALAEIAGGKENIQALLEERVLTPTERIDFFSEEQLDESYLKAPNIIAVIHVEKGADQRVEWPTKEEFEALRQPQAIAPKVEDAVGEHNVEFTIVQNPASPPPPPPDNLFGIGNVPYDSQHAPLLLKLGQIDKWKIGPNHPFHIHVNPFYDVTEEVWRDTLRHSDETPRIVLTKYEKYIGKFVFHCHILDHEDQGMMRAVEVVNTPDDLGTVINQSHRPKDPNVPPAWEVQDWTLPGFGLGGEVDVNLGSILTAPDIEKVVLVFLEKLECSKCSEQIAQFEKKKKEFENKKTRVIFVVPGPRAPVSNSFTFVSDESKAQYARYGVGQAGADGKLVPKHGIFHIGRKPKEKENDKSKEDDKPEDDVKRILWRSISRTPYMDLDQLLSTL